MRSLTPVLLIGAVLAGAWAFMTGKIPGYGQGAPQVAAPAGIDNARQTAEGFIGTREFYLAVIASVLATIGIITWRRIGGWGRGMVLVVGTIAAMAWLVR